MSEENRIVEIRIGVTEHGRMKLEVLKNKIQSPNIADVILQALSAFTFIIDNDRAGGRTIIEDKDGKATILKLERKVIK